MHFLAINKQPPPDMVGVEYVMNTPILFPQER